MNKPGWAKKKRAEGEDGGKSGSSSHRHSHSHPSSPSSPRRSSKGGEKDQQEPPKTPSRHKKGSVGTSSSSSNNYPTTPGKGQKESLASHLVTRTPSRKKKEAVGDKDKSTKPSPQGLVDAVAALRLHVVKTDEAQALMAELDRQLKAMMASAKGKRSNSSRFLLKRGDTTKSADSTDGVDALDGDGLPLLDPAYCEPKYLLLTNDLHTVMQATVSENLTFSRATYAANSPSEDRYTVVVGEKFVFAGVWDGHGGDMASEFAQSHIYPNFKKALLTSATNSRSGNPSIREAFKVAYKQTDNEYMKYAKSLKVPTAQFAGTCAVACYIDIESGTITCGNLGDSRAVLGTYEKKKARSKKKSSDGHEVEKYYLRTTPLSVDHGADNLEEQKRIRALHPYDRHVLMDVNQYPDENPDWRVKKIAAFTRSLGDFQLKDKGSAALFNSYVPHDQRLQPRPGVPVPIPNDPHGKERVTPPYISNAPEIKEESVNEKDGFLIIACDGVWDEMTSEEAVQICGKLYAKSSSGSNIAELFIEETLKKAAKRIADTDEEEPNMTVKELKSRNPGKEDYASRSWLHDDITVIILAFSNGGGTNIHHAKHKNGNSMPSSPTMADDDDDDDNTVLLDLDGFERLMREKLGGRKPFRRQQEMEDCFNEIDKEGTGYVDLRVFEEWWAKGRRGVVKKKSSMSVELKKRGRSGTTDAIQVLNKEIENQMGDKVRNETNEQIMILMNLFDGMNKRQLKILYDALDVDGDGTLDRGEIGRLLSQALSTTVTPIVIDTVFSEMDDDNSGEVDLNEFTSFFGVV